MNIEQQGGTGGSKPGGSTELGRGAIVGRYMVVGMIGKGAMGEVYAAYDPELDRKIALKLLRPESGAGVDPSEGRSRLLREAQAIARLSDPNVVMVFDVGTFEDRVFLAMEFVDGNTVGYWLQAKPRTWREVVAIFTAAGRGLASAHRAGVVHRDFKPENVMIGRDGKVRVMDFGLARTIDPAAEKPPATEPSRTRRTPTRDIAVPGASACLPPRPAQLGAAAFPAADAVSAVAETSLAVSAHALRTSGLAVGARVAAALSPGLVREVQGTPVSPGIGAWTEADTATRDLSKDVSGFSTTPGSSALNSRLTVTGALMGTPAYMAPEQFGGGTIDARTDQFSFCLALYEALYGERPFAGKTINELSENVIAGHLRPTPSNARIPGWLRRVLLRGLRVDRAARHPSMEALLAALARDPARTQRRAAAGVAIMGVIAVLGVGLVRAQQQQRLKCLGADAKLAGIWELPAGGKLSPRKQAIRRAFMATGKRYAADSFTLVMNALDRYVVAWNDMHRDSCEATNKRGEQSAEVLDLRTSCLQDRLNEVRALTGVFSDANGDVVTKAAEAVQAIRPVEQCADIAALRSVVKPPEDPAIRRAVAGVRTQLADVKALTNAGRYKVALKMISEIVDSARGTDYRPVIAEALLHLAELQMNTGDALQAEKHFEEAVWAGEYSHHDEVVAQAEIHLVYAVGYLQGRYSEAERWARHAGAVLGRLGPGHDVLAAWRSNNLGAVYERQGRLEDAVASDFEALALKEKALGDRHFDVGITQGNVALPLFRLGRAADAIERNQKALEILRATVGADHPQVAMCLSNGAEFLNAGGRHADARSAAKQALAIWGRELDEDHPFLAYALIAIGWSHIGTGEPELAIPYLERSLRIREVRDPQPDLLGDTKFALARALFEGSRDPVRALALAEQARADYQRSANTIKQLTDVDRWIAGHFSGSSRLSMR